ncbi:MAG: hypothetical protein ABIL06_09305 [Pseudomonadota bacterium]
MEAEYFAGIDIGSITAKCVIITNGGIASKSGSSAEFVGNKGPHSSIKVS